MARNEASGKSSMTDQSSNQDSKARAVDFLLLVVRGDIDEAYAKYVDLEGKHHNAYFPAKFPMLKKAMLEEYSQHPHKQLKVKHVIGDGNLVAVHSNLVFSAGQPGMSVVHIFRFKGNKIVEMWDVGQEIPLDSPNQDGAF